MSRNLEIESKSMIAKNEYKLLMKKFSHIKNYSQINYYIFSDELLEKRHQYALRARAKKTSIELTLKVRQEVGKLEINQEIDKKTIAKLKYFNNFPDGEIKDYLLENKICDISKLHIIGKMKTIRKDVKFLSSLVSIDKSIYNHHVDYEVECEDNTPLAASTNLSIFLSQNGVKQQKTERSKLGRFLETI